jgi:hypothetical protein
MASNGLQSLGVLTLAPAHDVQSACSRVILHSRLQLARWLRGCLPEQARKAGHLEEEGADKQDLHRFADRVHTVLKNPIDTSLLGKV